MINIDSFDEFSREYLIFLKKTAGDILQGEELYLDEKNSLVESIQNDVKNINLSIELFLKAKKANDELAMRAALLNIRCFMMGLYGVFYQTVEDIERALNLPKNIPFPDDYKIPEHYHYPIK